MSDQQPQYSRDLRVGTLSFIPHSLPATPNAIVYGNYGHYSDSGRFEIVFFGPAGLQQRIDGSNGADNVDLLPQSPSPPRLSLPRAYGQAMGISNRERKYLI